MFELSKSKMEILNLHWKRIRKIGLLCGFITVLFIYKMGGFHSRSYNSDGKYEVVEKLEGNLMYQVSLRPVSTTEFQLLPITLKCRKLLTDMKLNVDAQLNVTDHKNAKRRPSHTNIQRQYKRIQNSEAQAEAERVYTRRKERLLKSCDGQSNNTWSKKTQLIVAPEQKLVVCVVQKAGSTSWHKLVYNLREPDGVWDGDKHIYNKIIGRDLEQEKKEYLMNAPDAIRVITVRHPLSRIISGWNDKFRRVHANFNDKDMFKFMPGLRNYIGRHKPADSYVIAFEDFVQYLVDVNMEKRSLDMHFRTIEDICDPCHFPYDYIVKAELFSSDSWYVLNKVNSSMKKIRPHAINGIQLSKKNDLIAVERKRISMLYGEVHKATLHKLKNLLHKDLLRFNYDFDVETLTVDFGE